MGQARCQDLPSFILFLCEQGESTGKSRPVPTRSRNPQDLAWPLWLTSTTDGARCRPYPPPDKLKGKEGPEKPGWGGPWPSPAQGLSPAWGHTAGASQEATCSRARVSPLALHSTPLRPWKGSRATWGRGSLHLVRKCQLATRAPGYRCQAHVSPRSAGGLCQDRGRGQRHDLTILSCGQGLPPGRL